jgi:hypothetical protein
MTRGKEPFDFLLMIFPSALSTSSELALNEILRHFSWLWWYQSEIGFSAVSAVRWPQPLRHKIYIWTIFTIGFNDMNYICQRKFSHQYIYGNLTPCACRKVLQRVVRSPEIESWIYPSSTGRRFRVVFSRSRQSNSNSIQIQLFFTSKMFIAVMKTAAPSSECSFPFSNIKYVDCSCSELYTNLTSTLMMKQSITQSSTVVESTRVKKCCVLSEASIFDFKI